MDWEVEEVLVLPGEQLGADLTLQGDGAGAGLAGQHVVLQSGRN